MKEHTFSLADIHTHIVTKAPPGLHDIPGVSPAQRRFLTRYGSPDQLLKYFHKTSVEVGVILPLENLDVGSLQSTANVLRVCNHYPSKLIPFCCIDPRMPRAAEKARDYIQRGCKGLGEHKVSLPIDHRLSRQIYQMCNELQIPIIIHFGSLLEYDYFNPGLFRFEKIVNDYPEVTFIAHGPGWWKAISNEVPPAEAYPSGPIIGEGLADQILRRCRNVHADLSGTSGLNAIVRDPMFAGSFLKRHQNKLHYGTDFPFFLLNAIKNGSSVEVPFGLDGRHLNSIKRLDLSTRTMQLITRDNTLRLFDLA